MPRPGRILLVGLLTVALPTAVAWLTYSLVRLIELTDENHVRVVVARKQNLPLPTTMELLRLDHAQNLWGSSVMFAVVGVFGVLLLSMIVWLLGKRPPERSGRKV